MNARVFSTKNDGDKDGQDQSSKKDQEQPKGTGFFSKKGQAPPQQDKKERQSQQAGS